MIMIMIKKVFQCPSAIQRKPTVQCIVSLSQLEKNRLRPVDTLAGSLLETSARVVSTEKGNITMSV